MMHTQSGAASFAACLQLFRCHPLAVAVPSVAGAGGGRRSMVLRDRTAGYFVLTEHPETFVLRSFGAGIEGAGIEEEIRPREPVTETVRDVIAGGLPVPRHGSLLGWAIGKLVTALLKVDSAPPAAGDDAAPVPTMRVLPLHGSTPRWHWPSFACDPLGDFRLWEYVEWGDIVNVMPLVREASGRAFWVPGGEGLRTGHIVVTGNLRASRFWVPAGVYADHWSLREGIEPPLAGTLLASPGVTDLAHEGW
ncbi:MAG: hypothetical protein ACRDN0_09485 [Trebonia sp.]